MRDPIEVCEAVKDRLIAVFAALPPTDPPTVTTVERVYEFDVPDTAAGVSSLDGRRVYVFTTAEYSQSGVASRGGDQGENRVYVLAVEKYPGDERPVPNAWMDERVRWAKANIFDKLGDPRDEWLFAGDMWPEANECLAVYNTAELAEFAAFWSEFVFTFREQ